MTFPYVEHMGLAEERIFRPMIPITFQVGHKPFNTYALIDSGSDYTILPIEMAGIFDFRLADQLQYHVLGAGGSRFKIYRSPEPVEHIVKKRGFRDITGPSYVYFAESGSTVLLGQHGFLERYNVTLNGKKKEVEIRASKNPDR